MLKKFTQIKYFFPILVVFLVLLAYLPLYINGGFLSDFGDPIGQNIPNKFLLVEYLQNGILPLWNPFNFLGFPMLADVQVGTFYLPDILIFSVFSPLTAHNISILLHLALAAVGIYLLTKPLTKSPLTSISLSMMMVLSGSFLSRLVYLNFIETITFIPWIMLALQAKKTSIPKLTLLISLMIFAGHPVATLYSLSIIFIFFLFNQLKKWKALLLSLILGLAITTIQILPFLELKRRSIRDQLSYSAFTEGSLSLSNFFAFISPLFPHEVLKWDFFVHFGILAFFILAISGFFLFKMKGKNRNLYLSGITLFTLGILLSMGGNIPPLAKLLYELPLFNMIRVPARYIVLSHFGVLLALTAFFIYLSSKYKKITTILATLLLLNAMITPFLLLDKYQKSEGQAQYISELKPLIEDLEGSPLTLNSTPVYFLSSSSFMFPNRHLINLMHNVIGCNPMIIKNYHELFPIQPTGYFDQDDYFTKFYKNFELIGLKYFIVPPDSHFANFLTEKGWKKVSSIEGKLDIWQNPTAKPFVYFSNPDNQVTSIDFSPGKIILDVQVTKSDQLIVNQSFAPGWIMTTDLSQTPQPAQEFQKIIQSYEIQEKTTKITLQYKPKSIYQGLIITLIAITILIFITIKPRFKTSPSRL